MTQGSAGPAVGRGLQAGMPLRSSAQHWPQRPYIKVQRLQTQFLPLTALTGARYYPIVTEDSAVTLA